MSNRGAVSNSVGRAIGWLTIVVGVVLTINVSILPCAQAQSDEAGKILKAMSDYVTSQKTLSITFDSDIEVITSDLQKIQFTIW